MSCHAVLRDDNNGKRRLEIPSWEIQILQMKKGKRKTMRFLFFFFFFQYPYSNLVIDKNRSSLNFVARVGHLFKKDQFMEFTIKSLTPTSMDRKKNVGTGGAWSVLPPFFCKMPDNKAF